MTSVPCWNEAMKTNQIVKLVVLMGAGLACMLAAFSKPMKDFTQIGSRLEDEGFDALAIGGPRFIPIRPGAGFPLAIMNVTDARDASLHLFDDYAIVTAMIFAPGNSTPIGW